MGQAALLSASISAIALPIMRRADRPGTAFSGGGGQSNSPSGGSTGRTFLRQGARGYLLAGSRNLATLSAYSARAHAVPGRAGRFITESRVSNSQSHQQLTCALQGLRPDLCLTNCALLWSARTGPGGQGCPGEPKGDRIDGLGNQIKNYLENPQTR